MLRRWYVGFRLARAIAANDHERAVALLEARLEKYPNELHTLTLLAQCHEAEGDLAQAMYFVNIVLTRSPYDEAALKIALRYYAVQRDHDRIYEYACRLLDFPQIGRAHV